MATSGSFDFTVNALEIVESSLRVLGVLPRGTNVVLWDINIYNDSIEALNLMLKSWQNLGMQLWTRKQTTIAWEEDTQSVNISTPAGDVNVPTPLKVIYAYRRDDSDNDTELTWMTRQEYDRLSDKFSNGTPTSFFYDYDTDDANFYVWPIPDSNTNVVITYQQPFDDMDGGGDTLDFPQSWFEAVKWNLAVRLAPEFGRPIDPIIAQLAIDTLRNAQANWYEHGSVFFRPSRRLRWK